VVQIPVVGTCNSLGVCVEPWGDAVVVRIPAVATCNSLSVCVGLLGDCTHLDPLIG
jgi:hypothetical protein